MELYKYLKPVDLESLAFFGQQKDSQMLINQVWFTKENEEIDLSKIQIAIIGVPESRNSVNNSESSLAPDEIRKEFYKLYAWKKSINVLDLGNLIAGKTVNDTYEILSDIIAYLIEYNIITIILGGSNDLAYANYCAYKKMEQVVNIVSVDARFDLGDDNTAINSMGYLNHIVLEQPNYLLNYSNIGYQTYLNSIDSIELMKKLYFDIYRVGLIRQDMLEVEPIVRNAEMVSIDISAIRRPDAPGNPNASPNGFYGEEMCSISQFAGISDKLNTFGIFEYNPIYDYNNQTNQLISQIIWYFVEGVTNRQGDTYFKDKSSYSKHTITMSNSVDELVFYRSKKTGRWWVVVPVINKNDDVNQTYYLPCTKSDYEMACKDVVPERWWLTFNKLNR